MKRIFRMLVFSAAALFLTSLWNHGFIITYNLKSFITASIVMGILYYLLFPLSKLILLPINILTMGLISLFVYIILFHFFLQRFTVIEIKSWLFPGFSIGWFVLNKTSIGYWPNIVLSSLSVTIFINLLEKVL